jgi:hypothetical protein
MKLSLFFLENVTGVQTNLIKQLAEMYFPDAGDGRRSLKVAYILKERTDGRANE